MTNAKSNQSTAKTYTTRYELKLGSIGIYFCADHLVKTPAVITTPCI